MNTGRRREENTRRIWQSINNIHFHWSRDICLDMNKCVSVHRQIDLILGYQTRNISFLLSCLKSKSFPKDNHRVYVGASCRRGMSVLCFLFIQWGMRKDTFPYRRSPVYIVSTEGENPPKALSLAQINLMMTFDRMEWKQRRRRDEQLKREYCVRI